MLSFDLLAIFTVKCNDSVTFSFLFSFFFVKNHIASFKLSEIVVCFWTKCSMRVY